MAVNRQYARKDGLLPARGGRPARFYRYRVLLNAIVRYAARRGERVIDAEVLNDHRP